MTVAAYDAYCDATHPSDVCPMCGIDCRCDGPHGSITDALISAAKSASSLRTLTPALGRTDEPDTTVCDHPLVELKATKPHSIEGAVRVCAYCGEVQS